MTLFALIHMGCVGNSSRRGDVISTSIDGQTKRSHRQMYKWQAATNEIDPNLRESCARVFVEAVRKDGTSEDWQTLERNGQEQHWLKTRDDHAHPS